MINIRFRKEKLSIQNIGRQRFWIGVVAGVISAISISFAFNYFREVYRYQTQLSADLLILQVNELQFFNYFFSSLATTLGFSITIWIWMSNQSHHRRKDRIYKQLSRTYALLVFWIILMIIARFGSILPILLYGMPGYENQFNLYEDYWIIFILMPLVIFMQSWVSVNLVYRSGKWILLSFVFCILTAFLLEMTTTVNQEKLNNAYHLRFEKDYQYIDKEVSKAKSEYGIEFDPKTIDILKKWHSESSFEQVMSIKSSFSQNNPVSIDTIILQKIVIRNFKQSKEYYGRISIENFDYALPENILKQIQFHDIRSNESRALFEVLKEEIDLVNTPIIDSEQFWNYTETERRRSLGANYRIARPLINQICQVRESLLKDKRYSILAKKLPEIKEKEK